jgi:hypothetical protein
MAEPTNEQILRAYLQALVANDADAMARFRDADWSIDYPQSGERIHGHANERAIADHYPGGLPEIDPGRIVGSEDRWVFTPSFTFERIAGSGEHWWVEGHARYPDGALWYMTTMLQIRKGLIHREITYWSQPFESPAWRAQWVDPIEPG